MLSFKKRFKRFAKRILFAINSFARSCRYAAARCSYRMSGHAGSLRYAHPRDIGVIVIDPLDNQTAIALPSGYLDLLETIGAGVAEKMSVAKNCVYTVPDLETKIRLDSGNDLPERTRDIPEFLGGQIDMLRTKQCHDIPGIEDLCRAIMPEIEKHIYGSSVETASSFAEIKFVLQRNMNKDGLFHSDRHYEDTVRMIIYMTDVDRGAAPFEYLRNKETLRPVRIKAADHPSHTANGRIPEHLLNELLGKGYERVKITGKKGTVILFDSKIIHKANSAKTSARTVLVFPIRPALRKPVRYVDPARIEAVYV